MASHLCLYSFEELDLLEVSRGERKKMRGKNEDAQGGVVNYTSLFFLFSALRLDLVRSNGQNSEAFLSIGLATWWESCATGNHASQ